MKRLLLTLFSIGWLAPAWLAVNLLLSFFNEPLLDTRSGHTGNSFPFVLYSSRCFTVAFVWFAIVAAFWVWQLSGLILARPAASAPSASARGD